MSTLRWSFLGFAILAVVLVPFIVFGDAFDVWTAKFLRLASERSGVTAFILALLLASDVLLPIPSSLVSTAAGTLLGLWGGTCVSLAGMTASSSIGYFLGISAGRTTAQHLVGEHELRRLEKVINRYGDWMVVAARAVPLLAEASTFFAGMSRMPLSRFFLLSSLSNFGISLVYAAVGASAVYLDSFVLALLGAILVPLLAMWFLRQKPGNISG